MKTNISRILLFVLIILIPATMFFSKSEDEREKILENVKAAHTSMEYAKGKFDDVLEFWEKNVQNKFSEYPKEIQKLINDANKQLKGKLQTTSKYLGEFSKFTGNFINTTERVDNFVNKAQKILPTAANRKDPFYPVNALLGIMEIIDENTKIEDKKQFIKEFGNPPLLAFKLIVNAFNGYLMEATKQCRDGAKKGQQLITDRGGRCFGGKGGENLSLDKKVRAWAALTEADLLCPTGYRTRSLHEVWIAPLMDNAVWIWDGKAWTRLDCGLGGVQSVFNYYHYAYGGKISTSELINWTTNLWKRFQSLKALAIDRFDVLTFAKLDTDTKICRQGMLNESGFEQDRLDLLGMSGNNVEQFIGRYIFSKPTELRAMSNAINDLLTNTYKIYGRVTEKGTDKEIKKATVEITSSSGVQRIVNTGENGRFQLAIKSKVTSSRRFSIKITHDSYKELTDSKSVEKQCDDFGKFTLEKKEGIQNLIISPATKSLKIGETVTFSVGVQFINGNYEKLQNSMVAYNGAPGGTFKAVTAGTFPVTATYMESATSATVTVSEEEEEEEEEEIEDMIEDVKDDEPDDKDMCSKSYIEGLSGRLDSLINNSESVYGKFLAFAAKFDQEISVLKANPCRNSVLAYCFAQATNAVKDLAQMIAEIRDLGTEIILLKAICPKDEGIPFNDLIRKMSGKAKYAAFAESKLGDMSGRLTKDFNCDENEVIQRGEAVSPSDIDPEFLQGGGNMTEIPGDGIDNDGNGMQDEGLVELAGYNVTFIVFDSGSAKDDMFSLSVSGFGTLGTSPKGGRFSAGLRMDPGTYTATVTCILAPDNIGTYTLTILSKGKVLGSISGSPPQGGGGALLFTVE